MAELKLAEVHVIAADYSLSEVIDRAVRIKREIEVRERELAKIKHILRQHAEQQKIDQPGAAEEKTVEIEGQLGSTQITFSKPVQEIDQSKARELISLFGDNFDNFFSLKIDYKDRPGLMTYLEERPDQNTVFLSLTIQKPSKPRVVILKT
jgi:hypothetical protein